MFASGGVLLQECLGLRIRRLLHQSCVLCGRNQRHFPKSHNQDELKELLHNSTVGTKKASGDNWLKTPYKEGNSRNQGAKAFRPNIHPQDTSIILFPGQGVQYVGMGEKLLKLPQVKTMYNRASQILGYDLLKLCLEGPKFKLDQTVYCQPAIFVASLASLQLMIEERQVSVESCYATAGFSVGEYAALVLANSLSFEAGLRLVRDRAQAMQEASEKVRGGMMTVFLYPDSKIGAITKAALQFCKDRGVENPVCSVANHMFPHCKVLAGNTEALDFIADNKEQLKVRKCKLIPVSGAFHCDLMKPAAEAFHGVLNKMEISDPHISVHSNFDGLAYQDASDIKKKLLKHLYSPVKWEQTMRVMYDREKDKGFPNTFELGPGKSLTSLLAYNNNPASKFAVNIYA